MAKLRRIEWRRYKPYPIIGVDEVGRGCLAGPVYAGAVILNPEFDDVSWTDSKTLSASRREILSKEIYADHQVSIGIATVEEIAEINILQASFLAMRRAIAGLNVAGGGFVVVDGSFKIPELTGFEQAAVVKGDLRVAPIAAASIVAKVARDLLMVELSTQYEGYGLETHKGYATLKHRKAIAKLGPTKIHRRTFAGVAEYL